MFGSLKALNGWIFLSFKACWLPGLIASQPPGPLASVLSSLAAFNYELPAVAHELLFFNLEPFKKRDADNQDHEFWKTKTPEERLSAVEFLREQCFVIQGYDHLPSIIMEINIRESDGENPS
jgi:hypothetical protein